MDTAISSDNIAVASEQGFELRNRNTSVENVDSRIDSRPSRKYQVLLVASGFVMIFQTIGINYVYGIFQEFYTSSQSNIKDAPGNQALVSLVGTIGTGLTWSGGIFVNPLIARTKHVKLITFVGVIIMSLGLFLASYCKYLWQLFLTQALMYGIGASMYYFPTMTLAPLYFDRHRGLAMGIILAGNGVGGLVIAPTLQYLLGKYGIEWALRILAFWNLAVGIFPSCVIRHRSGVSMGGRTRVNIALAKRGTFLYQAFGSFLQAAGNVVPLFYINSYSTSVLSYSRSTGSLFLAINSAVNSISRVVMSAMADKVGRQNTLIVGVALSGVSVLALWYNATRPQFIAFIVFYGIYAGGYNALLPTTITEIYGVENYSSVNGSIYFIRGLGSIFGAPIAGLLLGSFNKGVSNLVTGGTLSTLQHRYNNMVIYDGSLLMAAGFCVAYVRWLDARDKGRWVWKA